MSETTNRFFIANTVDRPCEELIVEKREDGRFSYVHPKLKDYVKGMEFPRPVALEDFGVDLALVDGELHGELHDVQVRESIATYGDGSHRRWQGAPVFKFKCEPL